MTKCTSLYQPGPSFPKQLSECYLTGLQDSSSDFRASIRRCMALASISSWSVCYCGNSLRHGLRPS
ncbi:hypothetical protein B0T18DRAFT_396533 [Schizothecium vesticola]|uniref:Uncharacterized protein n=1 Tax=Schizothecium vesticola TaxID=314040 RepID=A0AA40KC28_9PEZI|nr:hypothetical protein B0T18DRAFT_396533 [Schizothecium vesticola]